MTEVKTAISGIPTLDASNLAYEFEKVRIKGVEDSDVAMEAQRLNKKTIPPNLQYLDDFYDKWTGTSGTAFLDVETGQVIIAYTGTNKDSNGWQDIGLADVAGIGLAFDWHTGPAFDFYEDIRRRYGSNIVLTGHSLGGNVAQRVAIEYNVDTTVVYNAAPLHLQISLQDQLKDALSPFEFPAEKISRKQREFTGKVVRIATEKDPLTHAAALAGGNYLSAVHFLKASGGHGLDPDITSKPHLVAQIRSIFEQENLYQALSPFEQNQQATVSAVRQQLKGVGSIKLLYSSDGSLSTAETIHLDQEQARVIVSGLVEVAENGASEMSRIAKEGLAEAVALGRELSEVPFWLSLEPWEMEEAYAQAGVTAQSLIEKVRKPLDKRVAKSETVTREFEELQVRILSGIDTMIGKDMELAGGMGIE